MNLIRLLTSRVVAWPRWSVARSAAYHGRFGIQISRWPIQSGTALLLASCLGSLPLQGHSAEMQPALHSRWAEAVPVTAPHPEYPRPQMVRAEWQNLNGTWEYVQVSVLTIDTFVMNRGDQRQDIFLNDADSQNPAILSIHSGACGGNQQATQSATRNT